MQEDIKRNKKKIDRLGCETCRRENVNRKKNRKRRGKEGEKKRKNKSHINDKKKEKFCCKKKIRRTGWKKRIWKEEEREGKGKKINK